MEQFVKLMRPEKGVRILDVGGYAGTWNDSTLDARVTLLNLPDYAGRPDQPEKFEYVHGDGRALEYPDQSWEIIFSNSVIEHIGDWTGQQAFAREVVRVGRSYWVQTPAKEFFLDPHLLTPFIHWLPRQWVPGLLRYFTVWGWLTRPTRAEALDYWVRLDLRMLTRREMKSLFPQATILVERFLGMPKSYVACFRQTGK
jgi:ubiquinone/menaquinone biosynthesis C-methylase UbiE